MRLYQRPGSPFWWLDTTVAARRHRISTGETGKRQAAREAERLIDGLRQQAKRHGDVWTVGQCLTRWWHDHAQHLRSADAIWSNIENLDRCLDGTTPIDRLTSAMLMDFRAKRRGEPAHRSAKSDKARAAAAAREPKRVQPPTINRDIAYLQAALNHARDIHAQPVPAIPWSKIKYPENMARNRFASHDEFDAMRAAGDADLADLILAAVATGLRRGNMRWLWHMVDLRGATVTIARTKGGVPMVVRLSPPVVEMLKRRRAAAIAATGAIPPGAADIFVWKNYRRRWDALRKELGMVDFHWHDLRHTFGTWARKAGVDLPTLKEAMAHKDIKTTARYAQVEPDEVASTFDKVAARMAQSTAHADTETRKVS